jgi:hypothetical protein
VTLVLPYWTTFAGPGTDGPGSDGPGSVGPGTDGPASDGPGTDGVNTLQQVSLCNCVSEV